MLSMTLPFALPPWVPWWVPVLALIPVLLYALMLFIVPFSVIGVKGRLEALDSRLDDIHDELRRLAQRLPDAIATRGFEDTGYTPPIFPVPAEDVRPPGMTTRAPTTTTLDHDPDDYDRRRRDAERSVGRPRTEPRLDRPR